MPVLLLTMPPLMVGSALVLPTPMALPALPPLLMAPRLTAPPLAPAVATPPLPAEAVNCANTSSLMVKLLPHVPSPPASAPTEPAVVRIVALRGQTTGRFVRVSPDNPAYRENQAQNRKVS